MILLGIDTSTAASAACVLRDGEPFEALPDPAALAAPPGHASQLLPAVADVMERAGVDYAQLDAIAVGVGPGGFTGLRIGVATARGLALAHGIELRPVSSLAALAAGMHADAATHLLPVIDAKRGEVFAALYGGDGSSDEPEDEAPGRPAVGVGGGLGEPQWAPFAARPEAVVERVREQGVMPVAAGDGSVRFRELLEAAGVRVEPDGSPAHVVRALHVCRLGAQAPGRAPETVLPEYVRSPDAKRTA